MSGRDERLRAWAYLGPLHGHVTGHVYADEGVVVFAKTWESTDPEDAPGRLTAVVLDGVPDVSAGSITDTYPVASWRYIDRDEFDRIIGLDEIRRSFGWHE